MNETLACFPSGRCIFLSAGRANSANRKVTPVHFSVNATLKLRVADGELSAPPGLLAGTGNRSEGNLQQQKTRQSVTKKGRNPQKITHFLPYCYRSKWTELSRASAPHRNRNTHSGWGRRRMKASGCGSQLWAVEDGWRTQRGQRWANLFKSQPRQSVALNDKDTQRHKADEGSAATQRFRDEPFSSAAGPHASVCGVFSTRKF